MTMVVVVGGRGKVAAVQGKVGGWFSSRACGWNSLQHYGQAAMTTMHRHGAIQLRCDEKNDAIFRLCWKTTLEAK